jgi:hypothetical protein
MATVDLPLAARNQPEMVENGINVAICHISLSASHSWSSGDVHRVGKLPNGAIPVDAVFYPGAATGGAAVFKFGTSASQELFFASATYSIVSRCARRLGVAAQVSISDDAVALYEWITMVATAGVSVGAVGDLIVWYKMPGQVL